MKTVVSILLLIVTASSVPVATTSFIKNVDKANIDETTNTNFISEEDLENRYNTGFDDGKKSQETTITGLENTITDKNSEIEQKNAQIAEKDGQIRDLQSENAFLKSQVESGGSSDYEALLSGEKCLVTFRNGSDAYDVQLVPYGGYAVRPENPTYYGSQSDYVFLGWYDDNGIAYYIDEEQVFDHVTYDASYLPEWHDSVCKVNIVYDDEIIITQFVRSGNYLDPWYLKDFDDAVLGCCLCDENFVPVSGPCTKKEETFYFLPVWNYSTPYNLDKDLLNNALKTFEGPVVVDHLNNYSADLFVGDPVDLSSSGNIKMYSGSDGVRYILSDDPIGTPSLSCLFQSYNFTSIIINNLECRGGGSLNNTFSYCPNLRSVTFGPKVNFLRITDTVEMFKDCSNLVSVDFGTSCNFSKCINASYMFSGCSSLKNIVGDLTFASCNVFEGTFSGCKELLSLSIKNSYTGDTATVTRMFNNCSSLVALDLSDFVKSSIAYRASSMFDGCSSLTTITCSAMNVSDDSGDTDFSRFTMFNGCTSLVGGTGFSYDKSCVNSQYASPEYYFTYVEPVEE